MSGAALKPHWVATGEHTGGRVSWEVDYRRLLLTIRLEGGVTDADLSDGIPRIWTDHPEVLDCCTLVDARYLTGEGRYGWRGLRDVSRQWKQFAMGRDTGSRSAIVLRDTLLTKLARAVSFDYPGTVFRIFFDIDEAEDWLGVK
ncbi:MAG: STAS/SEC14 domain-containing protein [Thalassobaculaceae bacterium]